ncbi:hypothetical protein M885DRAFT_273287 [Pelagophyceae sp. CCMP2097]|nr:hypothetical protein M885DRAFT_273287 [Pelagophyceae sp. CCMP2097]
MDPDPDSGFLVQSKTAGTVVDVWVATVATPQLLVDLLKACFQFSALQTFNRLGRNALHEACFANKCDSHEAVVRCLLDQHTSDLRSLDDRGCDARALLLVDRGRPGSPTGHALREDIMDDRREALLHDYETERAKQAAEAAAARKLEALADAVVRGTDLDVEAWKLLKDMSTLRRTFAGVEEYECSDTRNRFYRWRAEADEASGEDDDVNLSADDLMAQQESTLRHSWERPAHFLFEEKIVHALELVRRKTSLVRRLGRWDVFRDSSVPDEVLLYVSQVSLDQGKLGVTPLLPGDLLWPKLHASAVPVGKLGGTSEWSVLQAAEAGDNVFYYMGATKDYRWTRPVDAVERTEAVANCTAMTFGGRATAQAWYDCQECSEDLQASRPEGDRDARRVEICIHCVKKCHRGHRGIKYVRTSSVNCKCSSAFGMCDLLIKDDALADSSNSAAVLVRYAVMERHEAKRLRILAERAPAVLAFLPPQADARAVRGWALCRRLPRTGASAFGWQILVDPTQRDDLEIGKRVLVDEVEHQEVACKRLAQVEDVETLEDGARRYTVRFLARGRAGETRDDLARDEVCTVDDRIFFWHNTRCVSSWELPSNAAERRELELILLRAEAFTLDDYFFAEDEEIFTDAASSSSEEEDSSSDEDGGKKNKKRGKLAALEGVRPPAAPDETALAITEGGASPEGGNASPESALALTAAAAAKEAKGLRRALRTAKKQAKADEEAADAAAPDLVDVYTAELAKLANQKAAGDLDWRPPGMFDDSVLQELVRKAGRHSIHVSNLDTQAKLASTKRRKTVHKQHVEALELLGDESAAMSVETQARLASEAAKAFDVAFRPHFDLNHENTPWPDLGGTEWDALRENDSRLLRYLWDFEEWEHRKTQTRFWVDRDCADKETAVRKLQRLFRQCAFIPAPPIWYTQAYHWEMPRSVAVIQENRNGWALLRRRALLLRDLVDLDDRTWQEFMDPVSGEMFYHLAASGDSQWAKPDLVEHFDGLVVADLEVGDDVFFRARGSVEDVEGIVIRLRTDETTRETLYDVSLPPPYDPSAPPSAVFKWIKRDAIYRTPLPHSEMLERAEEAAWIKQLRRARENEARAKMRYDEAYDEKLKSRLRRTFKSADSMARSRLVRADAERAALDRVRLEVEATQRQAALMFQAQANGIDAAAFLAQQAGTTVLRMEQDADSLNEQLAVMAKAHADVESARVVREEAAALKQSDARARDAWLEKKEDAVTSPRSRMRRGVLRLLFRAARRQENRFVICEWGCREWVCIGRDKLFHEKEACAKRVLPCALGCDVYMRDEEWGVRVSPTPPTKTRNDISDDDSDDDPPQTAASTRSASARSRSARPASSRPASASRAGGALAPIKGAPSKGASRGLVRRASKQLVRRQSIQSQRSAGDGASGSSSSFRAAQLSAFAAEAEEDEPAPVTTLVALEDTSCWISTREWHERHSCPFRLVPCDYRCGEWVAFLHLAGHLADLCIKRPFPPILCRNGCGEQFHGNAVEVLKCEADRLEHELEACDERLVACYFTGCAANVKAKDRREHRNLHILRGGIALYTVPGVYAYKVRSFDVSARAGPVSRCPPGRGRSRCRRGAAAAARATSGASTRARAAAAGFARFCCSSPATKC